MTLYTVVSCPNCKYARVVPRHPERTACGKCHTSAEFDSLRHYYQSEDKDAAANVRAAVQARINDLEDRFEDAFEKGHIAAEVESVVADDNYLREKGADVEAIRDAEERAESGPGESLSKREVLERAIADHGESRESVIAFADEYDVSPEWVNQYLNKRTL